MNLKPAMQQPMHGGGRWDDELDDDEDELDEDESDEDEEDDDEEVLIPPPQAQHASLAVMPVVL